MMGRPLLGSKDRRRNSLQAYLTDQEYEDVYHVAIKQDMHLSAWFRKIILREVKKKEATNAL